MLITEGTVCTDKTRYDALIGRYPLASRAFDVSLEHPPKGNRITNGLLSLSRLDSMGTGTAAEAQEQIVLYEDEIFGLSPIFRAALSNNAIRQELEMFSGYDVYVDPGYETLREPARNAKIPFTPEDIKRLNEEEKEKQKGKVRKNKFVPGFNADARDLRIKSAVTRFQELTGNLYGSAIPTFRFVDPRFAFLVLTSEGFGTNSTHNEERIGALNIIARLLIDTHEQIQNSVSFDDTFKGYFKVINQIRQVLKPIINDRNERLKRNATILDSAASRIIDEGIKVFERLNELTKPKKEENTGKI
jgi:hypothetical protein